MKKKLLVITFIMLCISKIQAQNSLADTLQFKNLPDTLRKTIYSRLSTLMKTDTVVGRFSYVKNSIMRSYTYKVYLDDGKLFGFYTYYYDCSNCAISHQLAFIKAIALYCCKDPRHNPKETAKTKKEILEIKRKNGCSKVGICIY